MIYSFLLLLLVVGSVPLVFADSTVTGYDYFDIVNPDGSHTWSNHYPYVLDDNGQYVPYFQNGLNVNAATGSVTLNQDGSYSWNGKFTDNIIGKYSDVSDQVNWIYPSSLNDDIPDLYFANAEFHSNKIAPGIANMDYKYVFETGKWKTELTVTNFSGLSTKVFGFDQIVDLNSDLLMFGGVVRNLDNYDGVTFDKAFLDSNGGKVLNLLNGINFDFDLGYDSLYSITVYDTGQDSSRLVFDYRTSEILLPGQTLVIDPLFSSNTPIEDGFITEESADNVCDPTGSTYTEYLNDGELYAQIPPAASAYDCVRSYVKWDISSVPDAVTVTDVVFKTDLITSVNSRPCDIYQLENDPLTATEAETFLDIGDGTNFLQNYGPMCYPTTGAKTLDLGPNADSSLTSRLQSGIDWFGIGIKFYEESYSGVLIESSFSDSEGAASVYPTLEITYDVIEPDFKVNLSTENVGDMAKVNGNVLITIGVLNVTSIDYLINGTVHAANATGQNYTGFPTTINFGPFYYQQTDDSAYNHTVSVNVQNYNYSSFSNSSSSIFAREYGPNYFTAIDPTQGLVNYTFTGSNTIQVNRDMNGSSFSLECQYLTQAQAFTNDLISDTWDNYTNAYYYSSDTTGYYYLRCFNDGELFVTAIPQNYSNALVPGLIIFDQLGGFFGAPSIILVILALLSLGTGRNYPIILLIAASVTGILLALELLVLDPGIIVALIVIAGIGLFGIRKFY